MTVWRELAETPVDSVKVRLALARDAVARFPDSAAVQAELARLCFGLEDFEAGAQAGLRAIGLGAAPAGLVAETARALVALGRADEALVLLDDHPGEATALIVARGEALRAAGRLAQARLLFEAALAARPDHPRAAHELAALLSEAGEWSPLLALTDEIAARGPLSAPLADARLQALIGVGRHADARALIDFDAFVRIETIEPPPGIGLEAFNAALAEEVSAPDKLRLSDAPRLQLVGGEQVEDLQARAGPALTALFAILREHTARYFAQLPERAAEVVGRSPPARARLAPWALLLGPDDFQAAHYHLQSAVSGVYYVQAPDRILAPGGRDGALVIPCAPRGLERDTATERVVQPRPGRLVMFPGFIPHRTLPSRAEGQRISIAFNVVAVTAEAPAPPRTPDR